MGAARQRGLDLLASGDGWELFGLRAQDIIRTWADLAEAGLELTPPLGQATRDSDGSYYRWWVAGQGADFRTGRLPNLMEYESDPYRYERIPLDPPEPGVIQGAAGVDVQPRTWPTEAVPAYTLLLGGPPVRDHDDVVGARSARWTLSDGRYIRLLAPGDDDGLLVRHLRRRGRGVCAVAFATSDIGLATEQLSRHGIRATATATGVDGEALLETATSLDACLTLRENPTTAHAR